VITIGTPSKGGTTQKQPAGGSDESDGSGDAGENPDDTIPTDQQL
jgi:hypothetical protein